MQTERVEVDIIALTQIVASCSRTDFSQMISTARGITFGCLAMPCQDQRVAASHGRNGGWQAREAAA